MMAVHNKKECRILALLKRNLIIPSSLLFILLCAQLFVCAQTPQILRGPYLQKATSTGIVIRWRTNVATDSRVYYGTAYTSATQIKDDAAVTTEHVVELKGLLPHTKYYYGVGSSAATLEKDTANYFFTLPEAGKTGNYYIGVFGDCGNNSTNQRSVRAEFNRYVGGTYVNAWLALGDNAYTDGTDEEYQTGFFSLYRNRFRQTPVFPVPGNHEYANDSVKQRSHRIPYYDIFTLPVNGEAGGQPSENPAYYSYDLGNIHFVTLDSYGVDSAGHRLFDTVSRQVRWLKRDLDSNKNRDWIVVYFHHPPYTLGSHNSDTETPLIQLRQKLLPVLERYGVDLVLCGHSHVYERSALMGGHYGKSTEFTASFNISNTNGRYDGSSNACVYAKGEDNKGTVYVVTGSAGQLGGQQVGFPMAAMKYSNSLIGGSLLLQVRDNRLDAKWICSDGPVRDQFTIMKKVNRNTPHTITEGETLPLTASFLSTYFWSSSAAARTRAVTVAPAKGAYTVTVRDSLGCLRDTFNITVLPKKDSSLLSVTGKFITKKAVQVSWKTTEDKSIARYFIERSVTNLNFVTVGNAASQNNLQGSFYEFTDTTNITVRSYSYRIRSVDTAGHTRFSDVAVADYSELKLDNDIVVMPNPAQPGQMRILFRSGRITVPLELYDMSGRLLQRRSILLTPMPQHFLPALRPGYYLVVLDLAGDRVVKKILLL